MFKPTPAVVEALRDLAAGLHDGHRIAAVLDSELARKRPDLTFVLLDASRAAAGQDVALPGVLVAAAVRAGCALLGERHPGATIEVRVPPWAAVQIGFESGPRHTRGTPPNVVEMDAGTFLALGTGLLPWEDAASRLRISGAHAAEAARAFPL